MSDHNFFSDFNENSGFDHSLLQTGQNQTENGYLQNEEALKYFKKRQSDWSSVLTVTSSTAALGLFGIPIVTLNGE